MKKIFILLTAAAALFSAASCQKSPVEAKNYGYLSFGEFSLGLDEAVETRAAANGNYVVIVTDSEGKEVVNTTYGALLEDGDYQITLPAGDYTLEARSTKDIPVAEFEQPVYGTSKEFSITAGETTYVGDLVCTLLQCKVTVSYSEEFLASVTGAGKTTVNVKAGYPLEYVLNANGTYDQSAGYFEVEGSTMTVVFSGNIEGKSQKMTKSFTNIAPKQWRQIKFIKKVNEQGNAVFDIVINDLVDDETLNNSLVIEEETIGEDPEAPKGDGGIKLELDYEAGCDPEITDLENIVIVPVATRDMAMRFRATVPNGVKKFNVQIDSDNDSFLSAVDAAKARELDLINPLPDNDIIFQVVPFPHGQELLGQTDIAFNLDAAQDAITIYSGRHTFKMVIVDQTGCKKEIPVVMVVE
ncbi:MAG: DUF4493 domain-containing protein [Bacteroidales bacterium]|nr:DUF4493 domain-containing protein [Bacteroidales bacterium]MBE6239824.1 DUF4493 domain-containing protein [Bacteroidales bacterium]